MEILFIVAVIFFIIGFFLGKARTKYEENIGEQVVNDLLGKYFSNKECHLLKNVTLPIAGGTTQIDHVLVSTKGIFVIETKDYSGWVFGNPKLPKWTQTTRWGEYKFQNPIHQNHKHIKELERYFDFLPDKSFKSIVVFVGDGKFKTAMPENVLYLDNLVRYIKQFDDELISLNRVFFVVGKLEFFRKEISHKTDIEHTQYLREKFGDKTT
jgi:hypothetical protein